MFLASEDHTHWFGVLLGGLESAFITPHPKVRQETTSTLSSIASPQGVVGIEIDSGGGSGRPRNADCSCFILELANPSFCRIGRIAGARRTTGASLWRRSEKVETQRCRIESGKRKTKEAEYECENGEGYSDGIRNYCKCSVENGI